MSMRPYGYLGAVLLLLFGLPSSIVASPPESADAEPGVSCSECHEQAAAFTGNPHARGQVEGGQVPNAVCESCHGSGAAHIEAGGDTTMINGLKDAKGANACLTCHARPDGKTTHRGSAHRNTDEVNCKSCHAIHRADKGAEKLLVKPATELCSGCHLGAAASFRDKPFAHRIGRGGMECSTCHNPHGRLGKDNVRETRAGEMICLSCHSDKRGPFAFEHGAMAQGDCTTCHEPHGSNNPKQLKRSTVLQLCSECHSPTGATYGSQPPSFHNTGFARYQNCTSCHTMAHGSNRSPALLK